MIKNILLLLSFLVILTLGGLYILKNEELKTAERTLSQIDVTVDFSKVIIIQSDGLVGKKVALFAIPSIEASSDNFQLLQNFQEKWEPYGLTYLETEDGQTVKFHEEDTPRGRHIFHDICPTEPTAASSCTTRDIPLVGGPQ